MASIKYILTIICIAAALIADAQGSLTRKSAIQHITGEPFVHYYASFDGVPLTDLNLLMDKGSATIKRVDTQNKPRNFGNISFNNGIVAVWTHKLDFWENLHVPGTYRFVVQGFQPPMTESVPAPSKDRLPDLRQTIYWNPQVNTTEQKSISATLSDETGEFVIEFFGIDRNGKIVSDYKLINVR